MATNGLWAAYERELQWVAEILALHKYADIFMGMRKKYECNKYMYGYKHNDECAYKSMYMLTERAALHMSVDNQIYGVNFTTVYVIAF